MDAVRNRCVVRIPNGVYKVGNLFWDVLSAIKGKGNLIEEIHKRFGGCFDIVIRKHNRFPVQVERKL